MVLGKNQPKKQNKKKVVEFLQKHNENVLEIFSFNHQLNIKSHLFDLLVLITYTETIHNISETFSPEKKFVDFSQKHDQNVVNCFGDQYKRPNKCDFMVD